MPCRNAKEAAEELVQGEVSLTALWEGMKREK